MGDGIQEAVSTSAERIIKFFCQAGKLPWSLGLGLVIENACNGRIETRPGRHSRCANVVDFAPDLHQVLRAGRQLLTIANDLLDAGKLASDDVAFNLESLIANLDYQARTPLNGVIGYSEILLENAAEQGREEITADLQKIHDAGKLFLARINNIIDFSRVDPCLKPATPEASDQSPLIDSVMTSLRELAEQSTQPALSW